MRAARLALVLGCLGIATATEAGLLPTKGSQLVTLGAGGGCPIPGHPNASGFNLRVGADGGTTGFPIPAKQILVLTDVVASATFQIPGDVFVVNVLIGNATQSNLATGSFATADASARSAGRAPGGFDARVGRVLRSSRREVLLAMSIRSRATPTCSRGFGFRRAW